MKNNEQFEDYEAYDKYIRHTEKYESNNFFYFWVAIILLALHFTSCTPDDYYNADEAEIGYALMTNLYGYPEPDTLYCLRKIEDGDTTFYETGCVYDRVKGRKDTIYPTYPWPLIRFVPYPKAIQRFEKCD